MDLYRYRNWIYHHGFVVQIIPWIQITTFLTIFIFFSSCSERERLNPLDPENPDTGGKVTGLSIISNRDTILVQWDLLEVEDLSSYIIYRTQGDSLLQSYDTLVPSLNWFYDFSIHYDSLYQYALQAQTATYQSPLSDRISIIPGPVNFLVADFYIHRLCRLTYDGNYLLESEYFNSPVAIVPFHPFQEFLVADYWNKQVHLINQHLSTQFNIELESYPIALCSNGYNSEFFVIEKINNKLSNYSIYGDLKRSLQLPFDVSMDTQMRYDRIGFCLWIVHPQVDSIYCVDLIPSKMVIEPYIRAYYPRDVAIDSRTGGCWVASDSGIIRIQPSGMIQTYKKEYSITDLSFNPGNGDCYYTGFQIQNEQWETGRIIVEPSKSFFLNFGQCDCRKRSIRTNFGNEMFLVYPELVEGMDLVGSGFFIYDC